MSLACTLPRLVAGLAFLALVPHIVRRRRIKPPGPRLSLTAASDALNLTLRVEGHCRDVTYVGVDSRAHLLAGYDVSAKSLTPVSAAHVNWARVLFLQTVRAHCPSAWVVYSDTDAYVAHRPALAARLAALEPRVAVLYMRGHWPVNSGFHAWRAGAPASAALRAWAGRYAPGDDFFAEQKAFSATVEEFRNVSEARDNGFLGWHMKGDAREKLSLARTARVFAAGRGAAVRTGLATALALFVACAALAAGLDGKARRDGGVMAEAVCVAGDFAARAGRCGTGRAAVTVAALILLAAAMLAPHETSERLTKRNLTHVLPGAALVWDHRFGCQKDRPGVDAARSAAFLVHSLRSTVWCGVVWRPKVLRAVFFVGEVIAWSGVLWVYAALVAMRVVFEAYQLVIGRGAVRGTEQRKEAMGGATVGRGGEAFTDGARKQEV